MKYIFLLLIGLSSVSMAEFSRDSDIVTDAITGLEWQDDSDNNSSNWEDAIGYCEDLSLGLGEWRLPNKNELLSLIEDTSYNPSMNIIFENKKESPYWTSTSSSLDKLNAWSINFLGGSSDTVSKHSIAYIRCVRYIGI
jgi:hypothetical protein